MKWDAVLRAVRETVQAVPDLADIYGEAIRLAGAGDHKVPSLEILLVADAETEQWAPCTLQFSQFVVTFRDLQVSERGLRRLFTSDIPATFGGMSMFCEFLDGGDLTVPSRDGYFGRAIRFRFTPLREQYEESPYP